MRVQDKATEIPATLSEASQVLAGMTMAKMRKDHAGYEVLREQFSDTPESWRALACAHQDLLRRVLVHLPQAYAVLQRIAMDDLGPAN
jgi:hypothetical protein